MDDPGYALQLGLFGGEATVSDGTHVVHAHLRNLPAGGTAFVAEHVRWNRGRTPTAPEPPAPRARPVAPDEADSPQLGLWTR